MTNEDYDLHEVIERLLNEVRQKDKILNEIKYELCCDQRTEGLSTVGAVKALYKLLHEKEEEILKLNKELNAVAFGNKRGK